MSRSLVLAGLLGLAAGPVAAQDRPSERGPRIEMNLPGGKVEVDCGRTSISDCAAAIRPLVDLAVNAPRGAGNLTADDGADTDDASSAEGQGR